MARVVWTRGSLADLERLRTFLARQEPAAAARAVAAVRQGVRRLATYPRLGHPIEGLPLEFREWIIPFGHGGYQVIYRDAGDEVTLLALRHGREADDL